MTKHVLSTMTSTVAYTLYDLIGDLPVARRKIRIHGGTGIPSDTSGLGEVSRDTEGKPLWTPSGMVTAISDEDAEILSKHPVFVKHLESGYLKFINNDISHSTKLMEKATNGMSRDGFQLLDKSTIKSRVRVKIGQDNDNDNRL